MNKTKMFIMIGLIIAIIIVAMLMVKNKDTLFKQKIELSFPDGCVETYINGELTTPVCEIGREMEGKPQKYDYEEWLPKDVTLV